MTNRDTKCKKCRSELAWRLCDAEFTPFVGSVTSKYQGICTKCTPTECFIDGCNEKAVGFVEHNVLKSYSSSRKDAAHRNDVCLCQTHLSKIKALNRMSCLFWILLIVGGLCGFKGIDKGVYWCSVLASIVLPTALLIFIWRYLFKKDNHLTKKREYSYLYIAGDKRERDNGFNYFGHAKKRK